MTTGPVRPAVVPSAPPFAPSAVASIQGQLALLRRSRTAWFLVALLLGVVAAVALVASGLQPDLAAQVRASGLVCPPSSSGSAASALHPTVTARPTAASVKASWSGTCEPPVISVWELPVAQDSPPASPRVRVKKKRY